MVVALLTGCDMCGPNAEPVIDVEVVVEVPISPGQYIHVAMSNPSGTVIETEAEPAVMDWRWTIGSGDGVEQVSGQYKIVAWLSLSSAWDDRGPASGDVQGMDLIDVTCTRDDGCVPARRALITLR